MALDLHYDILGQGEPLLLLHGLFGSGRNWHGVARALVETHRVILPDLRNHGNSPQTAQMDYPAMADDIAALLDDLGVQACPIVGHSMGGKVAMRLALDRPNRVERLGVVDIAPVSYSSRHRDIFTALNGLPLKQIKTRKAAAEWMSTLVPEIGVRQFLLTNLVSKSGQYHWRIPVDILEQSYSNISAFPATEGRYVKAVRFISGARSDYIQPQYHEQILRLFPRAEFTTIEGAGHWVHAERPQAFVEQLQSFLLG